MPAYVDTSALVKRYVAEVGSAWVRRLLAHPAQYVIYTSALAQVEVISALQRRVLCFRPACVNLDFPWPTVILIPERKPMTWRPLCRLTPFYTPNTNSTS